MDIPEAALKFFGTLYNFKPETYKQAASSAFTQEKVADNENADEDDSDDISDSDGNLSTGRCRKLQFLFQTMYYVHHCGRKRTPMHIMNAESFHALGRGGKIVTSILNHEGLALSYTELHLASFTAQHNKDRIALPSHFDPGQFTSGAIDNWDHEGARISEHDTVTVLFQDKPVSSPCKPKISDTQVTHGPQAFKEILPCQILSDFHKSPRNPDIPASYKVNDEVYKSAKADGAKIKDTTWSLTRIEYGEKEACNFFASLQFFADKGVEQYAAELAILINLRTSVANKNTSESQKYMDKFATASSQLIEDLNVFRKTRSAENENFNCWNQLLRMMNVVYDLLRADREGIWELHLDAVQRALYLFAAFDSRNYLRWCSVYMEDMRRLSETAPSVYEKFSNGNFSIKDKAGRFTAVGGDQKLEQSINLSSKCSDGVIGHARQKQYVAQLFVT
ncbi:hypothetical protein GWK47_033202 [Chionoecetes opilio]|uniref:Uncharacterized protein n=1 Tax=Chionoecetes opilio TaxID=41210 RepID=A0A8J5CPN7_CHIOP|nr:hypothetical protein GWK47_033202 [Chionoecetes opilio]